MLSLKNVTRDVQALLWQSHTVVGAVEGPMGAFGITAVRSDEFPIRVVATLGGAPDWAAYYGPADRSWDEVASSGTKLEPRVAARLFPCLRRSRYRR